MTGKERLQIVVDKMKAAGVQDIKPFIQWDEIHTKYKDLSRAEVLDKIANDLASMLEAIVEGRTTIKKSFGDSKGLKPETDQ